jgi:hypothetical protein
MRCPRCGGPVLSDREDQDLRCLLCARSILKAPAQLETASVAATEAVERRRRAGRPRQLVEPDAAPGEPTFPCGHPANDDNSIVETTPTPESSPRCRWCVNQKQRTAYRRDKFSHF